MDSYTIHDIDIQGAARETMYIGNTILCKINVKILAPPKSMKTFVDPRVSSIARIGSSGRSRCDVVRCHELDVFLGRGRALRAFGFPPLRNGQKAQMKLVDNLQPAVALSMVRVAASRLPTTESLARRRSALPA